MNAPLLLPLPASGGRPDSLADALCTAMTQAELSVPHSLIPWRAEVWHGFTDGSAMPCPGQMSIGGYLVSPQGRITGRFAEACGTGSSYQAEFLAVRRLLDRARAAGIRQLVLHTDNLGLSKACRDGFNDHQTQTLRAGIARLRKGFSRLEFAWLPRRHNTLADWLSRAAIRSGGAFCEPIDLDAPALPVELPGETPAPHCCPLADTAISQRLAALFPAFPLFPMTPASAAQMGARAIVRLPQGHPAIPCIAAVDLPTLEVAASRRERQAARALAGTDPAAYRQSLLQILKEAAAGEPFGRFLRQRLSLRNAERHQARSATYAAPYHRRTPQFGRRDSPRKHPQPARVSAD